MTNLEFVEKLKNIADNMKTLYVMGGFGAPAGYGNNRNRYINNYSYNKQTNRASMIKNCSNDTFFFDCICLGKGILWGFNGDVNRVYGGADYNSNGVPDFGADSLISHCTTSSTDFSNIEIGEWLWMKGHAGYYVGDGMVIECTPAWKNCVQYTKLSDRKWLKHGKIKYLEYVKGECEMSCPYWKNGKCTKEEIVVEQTKPEPFKLFDAVKLKSGAKYSNGKIPQKWVYSAKLYIREWNSNSDTCVVSTLKTGDITGRVFKKDIMAY